MYQHKIFLSGQNRFSSAEKKRKTLTPPDTINMHDSFIESTKLTNLSNNKYTNSNNKSNILLDESHIDYIEKEPLSSHIGKSYSEKKKLPKTPTSDTLQRDHIKNSIGSSRGIRNTITSSFHNIINHNHSNNSNNNSSPIKSIFNVDITNAIKCQIHNENFAFLHMESKNLYCIDCVYLTPENQNKLQKGNLIPLKKAMDYIIQENKNFLKMEAKPRLNQLERTIINHQRANNILLDKLKLYENFLSMEFKEIYDHIQKKETEVKNYVKKFLNNKIDEINKKIDNIVNLKYQYMQYFDISKTGDDPLEIFKFNFANILQKLSKTIDYNNIKIKEEDLCILDFSNKKKLKYEIDSFGKFLNKTIPDSIHTTRLNNTTTITNNIAAYQIQSNHKAKSHRNNSTLKIDSISISPEKNVGISQINELKILEKLSNFSDILNKSAITNKDFFIGNQTRPLDISANFDKLLGSIEKEYNIFNESIILQDKPIIQQAQKLFPISFHHTKLLYSLKSHSASSNIFHEMCDNKAPYLVIIQAENDYVFGYYSPVDFTKEERYSTSDDIWIFSLKNPSNKQMIFHIKPEKNFIALYNSEKSPCLGSTIKGKEDLYIDFDDLINSTSNIGYAYRNSDSKIDGSIILCGKKTQWFINEIEIFHVD